MRWLKKDSNAKPRGKAKSAGQAPRRKPPARRKAASAWRKPMIYGAVSAVLLGTVAGIGTWLWASGTIQRSYDDTLAAIGDGLVDSGLAVREVLVINREKTHKSDILKALHVNLGDPILTFDPAAARERVEKIGWVKSAVVERRFPNKVVVYLQERSPAAIWQREDKYYLVDIDGEVINRKDVRHYPKLKVITGDNAPKHAAALLEVLNEAPELRDEVVGAMWVGDRRWNLELNNRIAVRLPEQDPQGAWKKLASLIEEHKLLNREIEAIDLRQPDRLIIRMTRSGKRQLDTPEEHT